MLKTNEFKKIISVLMITALFFAVFNFLKLYTPVNAAIAYDDFIKHYPNHADPNKRSKLYDKNNNEFRFIGYNVPTISSFWPAGTRLADDWEIEDIVNTVDQAGGKVIRVFAFSAGKYNSSSPVQADITGPGELTEDNFKKYDYLLKLCKEKNIRVIFSFVAGWYGWDGECIYEDYLGKPGEFYTDTDPNGVRKAFKNTIYAIMNRPNSYDPNIKYKDDPTILCWETGNELNYRPRTGVTFNDRSDGALTGTYPSDPNIGINWGNQGWYTINYGDPVAQDFLYMYSTDTTEVVKTFTLPEGKQLESIKISAPVGKTKVVIECNDNPSAVFTDFTSENPFVTCKTGFWGGNVITIKVTCTGTDGASNVAFDDLVLSETYYDGSQESVIDNWSIDITSYIKSIDTDHLVMDGHIDIIDPNNNNYWSISNSSLTDSNNDIVSNHYYKDTVGPDFATQCDNERNASKDLNCNKALILGEFGFVPTGTMDSLLNTLRNNGTTGALLWAMENHTSDGGFVSWYYPWEANPSKDFYGYRYACWPGFDYGVKLPGDPNGTSDPNGMGKNDEINRLAMLMEHSYGIQPGSPTPPPLPSPQVPSLLGDPNVRADALMWKGSTGAKTYVIQRSTDPNQGSWTEVTPTGGVEDSAQYRPLFNDRTAVAGTQYYYRIAAKNSTGTSSYSAYVSAAAPSVGTITVNSSDVGTGYYKFKYNDYEHGWLHLISRPGSYCGDINMSASKTNGYYEIKFYGTQIKLYAPKGKTFGKGNVYIDDVNQAPINFYDPNDQFNQLVYTSNTLTQGTHTLRVEVTGTMDPNSSDSYITSDRVVITTGRTDGAEILLNTTFNTNYNNWGPYSGPETLSTVTGRTGAGNAVRVSNRQTPSDSIGQDITALLNTYGPGNYTLEAWVKLASGNDSGTGPCIKVTVDGVQNWFQVTGAADNTWRKISGQTNITWTGELTEAIFYVPTGSTIVNLDIDDVSLKK